MLLDFFWGVAEFWHMTRYLFQDAFDLPDKDPTVPVVISLIDERFPSC